MKTSAFYRRAFADAAFRHEKLDEYRFLKVVHAAMFWACLLFGITFSVITATRGGTWSEHLALFGAAPLWAGAYSDSANRLAALEAFEKAPDHAPEPTAE